MSARGCTAFKSVSAAHDVVVANPGSLAATPSRLTGDRTSNTPPRDAPREAQRDGRGDDGNPEAEPGEVPAGDRFEYGNGFVELACEKRPGGTGAVDLVREP